MVRGTLYITQIVYENILDLFYIFIPLINLIYCVVEIQCTHLQFDQCLKSLLNISTF